MEEAELLQHNREGLFPGIDEEEEGYLLRIQRLKTLDDNQPKIPPAHWNWARLHLKNLFDIEPSWLNAFYSNRSLAPWQGAASWFENGELVAIQLREGFRKGSFLKIYQREEILAHEAVHAARGVLKSGRFEEFFAYMSSEKKWRRILGPIFQKPWEIWPLIIFSSLGVFWESALFFTSIWAFLGFFRLARSHRVLKKAADRIQKGIFSSHKTRAILFRLTDAEIKEVSREKSFFEYAKKKNSLRWKVIRLAYFPKEC